MADDRQVTPEKQLLNLIEGSDKAGVKTPLEQARLKRGALSLLSFRSLRGALSLARLSRSGGEMAEWFKAHAWKA